MRRLLLILLFLVALVATACRDSEPQAAPTRAPSPEASPPPPPEPIRCPLTGVEAPPGLDVNRPALAVKIDNHPAARPQTGLETADIVYEELVEGGLTRFMGIYHCGDAADLGPTRSARAVDPDILTQYAPVLFAYSGGSPNVTNKVGRTPGVINLVHGSNGPAYARRGGRAPHNLYTSTDKIRSRPAAQGVVGAPRTGLIFNPKLAEAPPPPPPAPPPVASPGAPAPPAPPPPGPPGNKVSFSYSGAAVVSYSWDPAGRRYLRFQGGSPHKAASGAQLGGTNVVVMKVPVDRRGSSPEIAVTESGEAIVLRNGQAVQGHWVRPGYGDQTTLVDAAGKPIELAAGNTWINLLPNDRAATLE